MRPEFKGYLTQAAVHQLHEKQGTRPKQKKQQKERGGSDNQKRTKRQPCFNCRAKPAHPRSQCLILSVEKRDIMVLFASAKAKEEMVTSYKPSLPCRI